MADLGKCYALVDGAGKVYGAYLIVSMSEGHTYLLEDGTPRKIDFSIVLVRQDDSQVSNLAQGNRQADV